LTHKRRPSDIPAYLGMRFFRRVRSSECRIEGYRQTENTGYSVFSFFFLKNRVKIWVKRVGTPLALRVTYFFFIHTPQPSRYLPHTHNKYINYTPQSCFTQDRRRRRHTLRRLYFVDGCLVFTCYTLKNETCIAGGTVPGDRQGTGGDEAFYARCRGDAGGRAEIMFLLNSFSSIN
jgi:hypothetical protein